MTVPSNSSKTGPKHIAKLSSAGACIAGLLLILWVFDKFGTAWDDALQAFHGEFCLNFYLSGGSDRTFLGFHNMALYGAIFEELSAGFHRLLGMEDFFRFRGFLTGLTALACTLVTVRLAIISGARRYAWFAAGFLFFHPQFWGQAFINSKDIPFAAAYSFWWMSYICWFRDDFRPGKWMLLSASALGLTLGIRIGALPLIGFTVIAGAFGWILKCRKQKLPWIAVLKTYPWLFQIFVFVFGWAVMCLTWPTAFLDPIRAPINAFHTFLNFPWHIKVSFMNGAYTSNALPRFAFALEQFLSQPLWCIPVYLLGGWSLWKRWRSGDVFQRFLSICTLMWILPLFVIFAISPFSMYHGVRQTLFLWPAYAWLSALGLESIHIKLSQARFPVRWLRIGAVLIIALNTVLLIQLHPFSYTYRNPVVRMLPGGINGFDGDYHALSYRLAAQWMNDLAKERNREGQASPTTAVFAELQSSMCYSRYINPELKTAYTYREEGNLESYEFLVVLHPFQRHRSLIKRFGLNQRKVVHTIERKGQIYALIYQ